MHAYDTSLADYGVVQAQVPAQDVGETCRCRERFRFKGVSLEDPREATRKGQTVDVERKLDKHVAHISEEQALSQER